MALKRRELTRVVIRLEIVFHEKTQGQEQEPQTKQTQSKFDQLYKLIKHGADWASIMALFQQIVETLS